MISVPCSSRGRAHGRRSLRRLLALRDHAFELVDQIAVAAFGLGFGLFELCENVLQAVDGRQDERDGFSSHRLAVAKLAHQRFSGVCQRFKARQAEEAAGAFNGVDEAEDVIENLRVVRVLFELHQLIVHEIEALVGFGQEFAEKIVHALAPETRRKASGEAFRSWGSLWAKPLFLVELIAA